MATILDGKQLAQKIKDLLKQQVDEMQQLSGCVPAMVNVMIGEDYGACAYANSQKNVAQSLGIDYRLLSLPMDITQDALIAQIQKLDDDDSVNGILLHRPVPAHIDYNSVANVVNIKKDLEGINIANVGKMLLGETKIIPCTPASVMEHIKSTGMDLKGKEAVVVGASGIVGKPLSLLLLNELATVTVCHIGTSQAGKLQEHVGRADILVVAVGRAGLIHGDWIKEGAIVIDVGINRVASKIVGDVDFESAQKRASFITPVPGGVGPLTVVMLMRNCIEAFKLQKN